MEDLFAFPEAAADIITDSLESLTEDDCDDDHGKIMICRPFNLTLISASNLPEVRTVFDSRVVAKVTIGGDKSTEQETHADEQNGLNPSWNCMVQFYLRDSCIKQDSQSVVVKLYSQRTFGDRYIGEVSMSLKWLFDGWSRAGSTTIAFPINQRGVETSAVLIVSCSFGGRYLVQKPDLLKKVLVAGGTLLLKMTLLALTGSTG